MGFAPSTGLFSRLVISIDRLLMTGARASIRTGNFRISVSEACRY
jgi:hypothetical protein